MPQIRAADIVRSIRQAKDDQERTDVLHQNMELVFPVEELSPKEATRRWLDIKESDLIAQLFDWSVHATDYKDPAVDAPFTPRSLLAQGAITYIIHLSVKPPFKDITNKDADLKTLIHRKLVVVFKHLTEDLKLEHVDDPYIASVTLLDEFELFARLCYESFMRDDISFVKLFNPGTVLDFIFTLLFESRCCLMNIPPDYDVRKLLFKFPGLFPPAESVTFVAEKQEITCLEYCLMLFSAFQPIIQEESEYHDAATRAVARFGADAIARRCYSLYNEPRYHQSHLLLLDVLLTNVISTAPIMKAPLINRMVPVAMVKAGWECVRTFDVWNQSELCFQTQVQTRDLLQGFTALTTPRQSVDPALRAASYYTSSQLDHFRDLVLIMAHSLLLNEPMEDVYLNELETMAVYLHGFFKTQTASQRPTAEALAATCLHLRRTLRAALSGKRSKLQGEDKKSDPDRRKVELAWERVVEIALGLKGPAELSTWAEAFHRRHGFSVLGCYWVQCPLFRDTTVASKRGMLMCSGCCSVQYCSSSCRKRDWTEGGHKFSCKPTHSIKPI